MMLEIKNCWCKYIQYLHQWAAEHKDVAFAGCSPVSFDEWLNNEEANDYE